MDKVTRKLRSLADTSASGYKNILMFLDFPRLVLLSFSQRCNKSKCVRGDFLNQFSEGLSHPVHREPKPASARREFSPCSQPWPLSLLCKTVLSRHLLTITLKPFTNSLHQLSYPSAFVVLSCTKLDSQLQSGKPLITISYHRLLSPLSWPLHSPALSTHRLNAFLSPQHETLFAFVQNFPSLGGHLCIISSLLPVVILTFPLVFNYLARLVP